MVEVKQIVSEALRQAGDEAEARRRLEFAEGSEEHQAILRGYARFHRILGELLTELVKDTSPLWLTEQKEHFLFLDTEQAPMRNVYGKALYPVKSLEPYREKMDDLTRAQQDVLAKVKHSDTPHGLLMPVVKENVVQVKLNKHVNYGSDTRGAAAIRADLQERIDKRKRILARDFEPYRNLASDPKLETLEQEIKRLEAAVELLQAYTDTLLRKRVKHERLFAAVYHQQSGEGLATEHVYVRDAGIILVGETIPIFPVGGKRKERSDKVRLEPLVRYDNVEVFEETVWQAAKEKDVAP
jgi:hypothetical protein